MKLKVVHGERGYEVEIHPISDDRYRVGVNGRFQEVELLARDGEQQLLRFGDDVEHLLVSGRRASPTVAWRDRVLSFQIEDPKRLMKTRSAGLSADGVAAVKAQMPGKVVAVLKNPGDEVQVGEGLAVVESMKMQNELKSPKEGRVTFCNVSVDSSIEAGQILFQIE